MTKAEVQSKIDEETELINKLECSFPKLVKPEDYYDRVNLEYHRHDTTLRDAYWRRRNLNDKLKECKE